MHDRESSVPDRVWHAPPAPFFAVPCCNLAARPRALLQGAVPCCKTLLQCVALYCSSKLGVLGLLNTAPRDCGAFALRLKHLGVLSVSRCLPCLAVPRCSLAFLRALLFLRVSDDAPSRNYYNAVKGILKNLLKFQGDKKGGPHGRHKGPAGDGAAPLFYPPEN